MKMKKNLWAAAAVLSAAMLLGGCGGSEPAKEAGEMEKIETTEGTEKTGGAEKVETGETETQPEETGEPQSQETDSAEQESVSIRAEYPYIFSEGHTWVSAQVGGESRMAWIDTDGKIQIILDDGGTANVTPVYDGAFAVYYFNGGYAIYSTAGELLASSDDGDDSTDFRLLEAAGGSYWIEKTTATISERSTVQYCIDKNGNKLTDEFAPDDHFRILTDDGQLLDLDSLTSDMTLEEWRNWVSENYVPEIEACYGFGDVYATDGGLFEEFVWRRFGDEFDEWLIQRNEKNRMMDEGDLEQGWYDCNGKLVAAAPEGLPLGFAGYFKGGLAPYLVRGMDGKFYFTVIDETGSPVYEPVKISEEYWWSDEIVQISFNDGVIAFVTDDCTFHLIDKDGTLLDASGDISAFTGSITTEDVVYPDYAPGEEYYDGLSYSVFTINEGIKCLGEDEGVFSRLDGTPFDQAVIDDSTVHIQFTADLAGN